MESLECKFCNGQYDLPLKKPIQLMCGHSVCEDCYLCLLQPQENKIQCPFDNKIFAAPKHLSYTTSVMEILKATKLPYIYCDQHPDEKATFYSFKTQAIICQKCLDMGYSELEGGFGDVIPSELNSQVDIILMKFAEIQLQIERLREGLLTFQQKQKQFTFTEFFKFFREAQQLVNQVYKPETVQLVFRPTKSKVIQTPSPEKKLAKHDANFLSDSLIMKKLETDKTLLYQWLECPKKTELLYRGTKDGFFASDFHNKCDDKGSTVTIIKSDNGKLFGGYTQVPFTNNSISFQDNKAFLFSISNKTKHVPYKDFNSTVSHKPDYLVVFGSGTDIYIGDGCNKGLNSGSNLGGTYTLPPGVEQNSVQAKQYFAGSQKFKVAEIETYLVYD